ncbi:MAG: hypothetical protein AAF515_06235 [Pseudomonadota bacterium]
MTTARQPDGAGEVALAAGQSASHAFHAVLGAVARGFDVLRFADVSRDRLRRDYADLLARVEVARLASPAATEITAAFLEGLSASVVWQTGDDEVPLATALQSAVPAPPLQRRELAGPPGWRPGLIYRGRRWQGKELAALAAELGERGVVSQAAVASLRTMSVRLGDEALDLRGRRIAMLGANAEMAPTRLWLRAGAEILWLDVAPPPDDWLNDDTLAGTLVWPQRPVDLLRDPQGALAALRAFAATGPIDLGLYAYAPGRARELRLTAAMNAIVDALPRECVASVTMLVSPTTPTRLSPADVVAMQRRLADRPAW